MRKIYIGGLLIPFIIIQLACKKNESLFALDAQSKTDAFNIENEKNNLYYWSGGKKIPLMIDSTAAIFLIEDSASIRSKLGSLYNDAVIKRLNSDYFLIKHPERIELEPIKQNFINIQHGFKNGLIPTGEIVLEPHSGIDINTILGKTSAKLKIKAKNKYNTYLIKVEDNSSILNIANVLHESGLVKYCHPNFIATITFP